MASLFLLLLLAQVRVHLSLPMQSGRTIGELGAESARGGEFAAHTPHLDPLGGSHLKNDPTAPVDLMANKPKPESDLKGYRPEVEPPVTLLDYWGNGLKKLIPAKPLNVKGKDGPELAIYLKERDSTMPYKTVEKVYSSFSADHTGPIDVFYNPEVEHVLRGTNAGETRDAKILLQYFKEKIPPQEFDRRYNVLMFQSEQAKLAREWGKEARNIARRTGQPLNTVKKYGEILGLDKPYSDFQREATEVTVFKDLQALETRGKKILDEIKTRHLTPQEYERRRGVIAAVDGMIERHHDLGFEPVLVKEWQEQKYDVPRMVGMIDYARTVAAGKSDLMNEAEFAHVYNLFEPFVRESLEAKASGVSTVRDLEDIHIKAALKDKPEGSTKSKLPWYRKLINWFKRKFGRAKVAPESKPVEATAHTPVLESNPAAAAHTPALKPDPAADPVRTSPKSEESLGPTTNPPHPDPVKPTPSPGPTPENVQTPAPSSTASHDPPKPAEHEGPQTPAQ
ncbi:hypothetical protein PtA15_7A801 [Puccinia triticina]|uniref:RxLR effector candidate protein n=1 Tax=Puccinia triticina TaxID=208348 RepID=A0ABY7CSI2_9BASI|nr:uncharacterized protein PtA15_7A801 [Puccinia triticina]WAQ87071.1 hypothetical protein PtA15_7A801 [Puccinia triticina]